jgi:LacI family transcriptional regulator
MAAENVYGFHERYSLKCGVSVATVSKAITGIVIWQAYGPAHTQCSKEMGYLPNAAARALKTNRT